MTGSIAKFNVILEAKPEKLADLDKAAPQIQVYLRRTAARFGILTNGRIRDQHELQPSSTAA